MKFSRRARALGGESVAVADGGGSVLENFLGPYLPDEALFDRGGAKLALRIGSDSSARGTLGCVPRADAPYRTSAPLRFSNASF